MVNGLDKLLPLHYNFLSFAQITTKGDTTVNFSYKGFLITRRSETLLHVAQADYEAKLISSNQWKITVHISTCVAESIQLALAIYLRSPILENERKFLYSNGQEIDRAIKMKIPETVLLKIWQEYIIALSNIFAGSYERLEFDELHQRLIDSESALDALVDDQPAKNHVNEREVANLMGDALHFIYEIAFSLRGASNLKTYLKIEGP